MDKAAFLQVAVVGLTQGECHLSEYLASGLTKRIAICDTDENRLNTIGDKYRIPLDARYTSYEKMLLQEKPMAVSIVTPNCLHKTMVLRALQSGAHVLVEKPMAISAAEAEIMCRAAKSAKKILSINFNQRFEQPVLEAKRLFEEKKIGEIYFVATHWHRRRGVPWWYPLERAQEMCGGGAVIDLGVHVFDRALFICGYPEIIEVTGMTCLGVSEEEALKRNISHFSVEDFGAAMLRTKNGALFELESSWAANREDECIETRIYGTKGGILLKNSLSSPGHLEYRAFLSEKGEVVDYELCGISKNEKKDNVHAAFLRSVAFGEKPVCRAEDGLELCRITDAIYESSLQRKSIVMNRS